MGMCVYRDTHACANMSVRTIHSLMSSSPQVTLHPLLVCAPPWVSAEIRQLWPLLMSGLLLEWGAVFWLCCAHCLPITLPIFLSSPIKQTSISKAEKSGEGQSLLSNGFRGYTIITLFSVGENAVEKKAQPTCGVWNVAGSVVANCSF